MFIYIITILRHSAIKKDKGLRIPYEKRRKLQQELKEARQFDLERKAEKSERKKEKRLKEEAKRNMKLANEKKSEIYEVVGLFHKIFYFRLKIPPR